MAQFRNAWMFGIAAVGLVGCQRADQIESYTVPKEPAQQAAPAGDVPSDETADRMLVAILPEADRAWFLKVVGPSDVVESQEAAILDFYASLRPAGGADHPQWQLPDEWQQNEAAQMRAATIWIPTDDEPLEMSVIALPWTGDDTALLSNVNRWRGQLQRSPIGAAELGQFTRPINAGDSQVTLVDLEGKLDDGGMTAPFAGAPAETGAAPSTAPAESDGGPPARGDLPADHPPLDSTRRPAAPELSYEAPPGWQSVPATGMRKAAFTVAEEDAQALVTVIDFPVSAGPMMADPLANANRWRGEVGLPPLTESSLDEVTDSIVVDGHEATLIDALPDTEQPEQSRAERGTLAAMVTAGDVIWFVKLSGDRDLVSAQRDNFHEFLKSVRFAADDEAAHGD